MRRRRRLKIPKTVVNPDENFYFYWLMTVTISILYNLWTLIVRQSFPELQENASRFWLSCDCLTDFVFIVDVAVQLRTGYLEQGLMVCLLLVFWREVTSDAGIDGPFFQLSFAGLRLEETGRPLPSFE